MMRVICASFALIFSSACGIDGAPKPPQVQSE